MKESNNEDNVDSLLSFKGFSRAQQNIAQRLSRAIIKCNDDVPHNHLTSTFIRIMNVRVIFLKLPLMLKNGHIYIYITIF